jgi:DNA helicase II / ATP-dependent DNA helicase PcrA
MITEKAISPAEQASARCLQQVFEAMAANKNFLVEAGAGAGKTYTLIKALRKQIEENAKKFLRMQRRIACITYTNIAKDEIRSRTDNHPAVFAETIHAFAWDAIRDFQISLRSQIHTLSDRWPERIEEAGGVTNQVVIYNLGYPKITDREIFLHHDDVIKLLIYLLDDPKFQKILTSRYPVIFIDEYQDTNTDLANALLRNFILPERGPLIGFFGDHWQKIYGNRSIGLIQVDADKLVVIGKEANFRSDRIIVDALNNMRPELPQQYKDPDSVGEIVIYHSNEWVGQRRTGNHWAGDLPADLAHEYLNAVINDLKGKGWIFEDNTTKILMLTNAVLAEEQGYSNLIDALGSDDLLEKQDDYVSFLIDTVKPGLDAFTEGKYGKMIQAFGLKSPAITSHSMKKEWHEKISQLEKLCKEDTIGVVIDLLKETKKPHLPRRIEEKEIKLANLLFKAPEDRDEAETRFVEKYTSLRAIPYVEVSKAADFINDQTPFSTKHGVKGAQFDNVLVVLGRGWNHYNWKQMLEWAHNGIPAGKQDTFERNRNLFYVTCSRPKHRLALLFTQELSEVAIKQLTTWFGNVLVPFKLPE